MLKPLPLLRGEITYPTAKAEEVNILYRLRYPAEKAKFFNHIDNKRNWITTVVAHHLKLKSPALCQVADAENWYHGKEQPGQRVLIRFPLPYRVGEAFHPGNGDEKIRCEAGTYAHLQENCPEIPIPRLYGFATSDGETFTRLQNLPFLARCFQYLRRQLLSWLGRPLPTRYVRHDVGSQISAEEGSNIFVDKNWNITSLVDLEWASTRPVEMLRTPTWLTNKACDEIAEEGQEEYDKVREEFMDNFTAEEEQAQSCASFNDDGKLRLSAVMKQNWDKGIFWYTLALASPTGGRLHQDLPEENVR
ncbi:hypothetical protein V498_08999 [Pseudogymnoascus sp. VKM F-4517 (FW-2822)]|nr:hypothetical protein V498_08999 [Pseudogymnoascus sp. VKM F-4517 (FW-2822)]